MRLLALAMALLMLLSCMPALAEGAAIPEGYKQVAENSGFRLHLQEETMAVIIESKLNGELLYSTVQNPNTGNKTYVKAYSGYRHEIHNELELRDEVEDGLIAFMDRVLGN